MMIRKSNKSAIKINYWLLLLAVVIVSSLLISRNRKASHRAFFRQPAKEQQVVNKSDVNNNNKISMKVIPEIKKDILIGNIITSKDTIMVGVDLKYASRDGMFMHKEAYEAFVKMHESAANDGIGLVVISAFRSFDHQKRIWEDKWNGRRVLYGNIKATDIEAPVKRAKEILKFSAMPTTSRHHWGTDIDLNSFQNSYFESGDGKMIYEWLNENAQKFGFCQPYTPHSQGRAGGYEEEKWHWSYIPVAKNYLNAFNNIVDYADIAGFDGYETALELKVIKNYVNEINNSCIP